MAGKNNKALFDIGNLEQAKKLLNDMLNILTDTHTTAAQYMKNTDTLNKLYAQLNSLSEKSLGLQEENFGTLKGREKLLNEIHKLQTNEIEYQERYLKNESVKKAIIEDQAEAQKRYNQLLKDADELQKEAVKRGKEELKRLQDAAEKEYNKLSPTQQMLMSKDNYVNKRTARFASNYSKTINETWEKRLENAKAGKSINSTFTKKDIDNIVKETSTKTSLSSENFIKGSKGLNIASTALNEAGKLLKTAATTWLNVFKGGMDKQINVYNDTFEGISVRTGITRGQYQSGQRNAQWSLYGQGLGNNIGVSEVQSMWDSLAKVGMNEQDMFATAIDNVLTKKIVPYLNTTTQQFNLINDRVDGKFVKDIRGINQATIALSENNYSNSEVLNSILDNMAPLADEALQNLAMKSTKMASMVNVLMDEGGMTQEQAMSYVTQLYKQQQYGSRILSSGTTAEKFSYINALTNGVDVINNPVAGLMNNISSNRNLGNIIGLQGYNDTWSALNSSIMGESIWGGSFADTASASKLMNGSNELYSKLNTIMNTPDSELEKYSNQATSDFANDKNQTQKQLQELTMENISTEFAILGEKFGYWGDIIWQAIKGIGNILLATGLFKGATNLLGKGGGKALGIGAKLSSAGTFLNAGLQQGFMTGSTTMAGAGKLGFMSSTGGAIAGAGGILAGGAMAVKGGTDIYNDFKNNNVSGKTALSGLGATGGAAGAGALIALGASNPIGWVALAVGGLALGTRAIIEAGEKHKEALSDASNMYEEQLQEEMKVRKRVQQKEMDDLKYYQGIINDTADVEYAKRIAIEAGISTQSELSKSQYDNIEAVQELTNAYIESKNQFNTESNETIEALSRLDNENKSKYSNGAVSKMEEMIGGAGWNKEYHELSNEDRAMTVQTANALWQYSQEKGEENLSKEQKEIYDVLKKYSGDFEQGSIQDNWDAMDEIIDAYDKHNEEALNFIKQAMKSDSVVTNFVKGDRGAQALKSVGIFDTYKAIDEDKASSILDSLSKEGLSKKQVESYLLDFKVATNIDKLENLPESVRTRIQSVMDKHGIEKYRQGATNIPYDQIAQLHEGEAVLTATTANELRNLIDVYRETRNESVRFDVIIQQQTAALVSKMDQIIQTIQQQDSMSSMGKDTPVGNRVRNSMVRMLNTKSAFNLGFN